MPPVTDIALRLRQYLPVVPGMAVVAGSGVMDAVRTLPVTAVVPYHDIGLPPTTVAGHGAELLLVEPDDGHPLLVFGGRYHRYEGHGMDTVLAPVRLAHALGIRSLLLTNAAGGLAPGLRRGCLMLATDVMMLPWRRRWPQGSSGLRRPICLDSTWTTRIERRMLSDGLGVSLGTYIQVPGPSYETRAEILMLRRMGGHAVGMSTACEAAEASVLGMRVVACSMITNETSDTVVRPVGHDEVLHTAAVARRHMAALLLAARDTAAA